MDIGGRSLQIEKKSFIWSRNNQLSNNKRIGKGVSHSRIDSPCEHWKLVHISLRIRRQTAWGT